MLNLEKIRGVNKLEDKQIATVRTITGELIGGFLLYGIVFSILYNFIYSAITNKIAEDALILIAVIAIILQGITVFCIWRCSIATTFRKRLIGRADVKKVMRNLMIFTVIVCIVSAIMNFVEVNKSVDEAIDSNANITMAESYMRYIYDDDEIAQYEAQKEQVINETKTKLYMYLAVLEIGLLVVYLGVIPLQKKAILKYAV